MSITAARLQAEVGGDTKGFDAAMRHADQTVAAAPSKWGKALKLGAGLGLGLAAGVAVRGLTGAISAGVESLRNTGVVVAQTNAVIKSTGGSAHITADEIRKLSNATEDLTAIDDKAVQAGANMLLTFTNIKNEVGAGNDIFNQSVGILADMSTAMGTDMKSGAIQLGKALNDPLTGITALTRVGVTFSAQQKEQIKNFVEAGKTAEAQKVILRELNKEFGGSGAAFAATDAGKAAKFQDAIEGIQQSLATALLPAITRVRGQLTGFLSDPATIGQAEKLGETIAGIFSEGNLRTAASLMTTAAGAISTAIRLFSSLPPQVQALAVGAIALKKITGIGPLDIAKSAGGLLKIAFERGSTPANPLFVTDTAGGIGGAGAVGAGTSKLSKVAAAASKVFLIGAAVGVFSELKGILDEQTGRNREQATGLSTQTNAFVKVAGIDDMKTALAGIEAEERRLNNSWEGDGFAFRLNIDGVRDAVNAQKAALVNAITAAEGKTSAANVHVTERTEAIAAQKIAATTAAVRASMDVDRRGTATLGMKVSSVAAAARAAGAAAAAATRAKKWQFTTNVTVPVVVNNQISLRRYSTATATASSRGNIFVPS